MLVSVISGDNINDPLLNPSGPSGWTELQDTKSFYNTFTTKYYRSSIWYKVSDGTEAPSQTWTDTQPELEFGALIVYSGTSSVPDASSLNWGCSGCATDGTTATALSVTPKTCSDQLVLWYANNSIGTATFRPPPGTSQVWANDDTINGYNNYGFAEALSSAAATDNITTGNMIAGTTWFAAQIALAPAIVSSSNNGHP
jgi:hypothetical protein